jgi:hypothetical protein
MPKGLTPTSEQIVVSFTLAEPAINTFASTRIDLQLNALDSEVFVVTGVKMDLEPADMILTGGNNRSQSFSSISKQDVSTSALGFGLANPSVFATASTTCQTADTPNNAAAVSFIENSIDTPSQLEYVDVIATPDFFVNIQGSGNLDAKSVSGKLYGYRAKASSAVYASLVQSELLSQ